MNSSPGQEHSKLVPLLKCTLYRVHLLLGRNGFLLLLRHHNAVLKHFHDPEELIECQFQLSIQLLIHQQLLCFRRVTPQTLNDSLQLLYVNIPRLVLVKHVEDAPEILEFLLVVSFKDLCRRQAWTHLPSSWASIGWPSIPTTYSFSGRT